MENLPQPRVIVKTQFHRNLLALLRAGYNVRIDRKAEAVWINGRDWGFAVVSSCTQRELLAGVAKYFDTVKRAQRLAADRPNRVEFFQPETLVV